MNLTDLDMSSFRIDNYIEVYLKKAATFAKPFATMLGRKENEFTPVYLKVYIKRLSSCKEELPEIREVDVEIETTPATPPRQSSKLLEYDPTVNGSGGSTLAYTPSKLSSSEEGYLPSKVESDASNGYVPKPISPDKRDYVSSPEISVGTLPPQYKPSKISQRSRSQRNSSPTNKKKTPAKEEVRNERPKRAASARKDQTEKRPVNSRSDDEDQEIKPSKKRRNLYPPPEFHLSKVDDGWKSSRSGELFFFAPFIRYLGIIYTKTCCISVLIQFKDAFCF